LTGLIFGGFLPLLVVVPTLIPGDPSVLSAASLEGYNTVAAYRTALIWCIAGLGIAFGAARAGWKSRRHRCPPGPDRVSHHGVLVGSSASL
jgi:hypothetical protein